MKPLVILFGALALRASTITTPTPTITTDCTMANLPVGCGTSLNPAIYGSVHMVADAAYSLQGLDSSDGLNIIASAEAFAGGGQETLHSLASVNLDFFGSTVGPARQGLATYFIWSSEDHGQGSAFASGFINGLGACQANQAVDCLSRGTLVPFELGTPFELGLSVSGISNGFFGGGSGAAQISLRLFEMDGTPVTISDPVAVPEPSAGMLTGTIVLILIQRRAPFFRPLLLLRRVAFGTSPYRT